MKYIKILIIFLYLVCIVTKPVIATDTDILASQQEELNISEFTYRFNFKIFYILRIICKI